MATGQKRVRGSVWENTKKKKGYPVSVGSYFFTGPRDRAFKLTPLKGGKSRVYESPDAAMDDGWLIIRYRK